MHRRSSLILITITCLLSCLSANAQLRSVTVVTDFGINGRHAYFFVAQDMGFYRDAGLEVGVVRGQGSADAIKKVAAGNAQFGFADAGALVLARGNDNVPVKLVSMVYATPPQAIYALEESGIRSAEDLVGRRVADTAFSAIPVLFGAYAQASGIEADSVDWIVADGAALPSLLAMGRVEAIGQFTVGEPLLERAVAPKKLVRLGYRDAGLDYYGNGLIASESLIERDAALVRQFVAATQRGMQYAFAHPDEAGAILHRYHRQIDPAIAAAETREVALLADFGAAPFGQLQAEKVSQTVDVVSGAYQMKRPVTAEELYAPGFVVQP